MFGAVRAGAWVLAIVLLMVLSAQCVHASGARSPSAVDTLLFPYYESEQFLASTVKFHFEPATLGLKSAFNALKGATHAYCSGADGVSLAFVLERADSAYHAWLLLSAVVEGPMLEGNLPKALDFQPFRVTTVQRALASYAADPAVFNTLGSPAKGFPVMFYLLNRVKVQANSPECNYLLAVVHDSSQTIEALAWSASSLNAQLHFNQVLGAVQRLTWDQLEKPRLQALDQGRVAAPLNVQGLQVQWAGVLQLLIHQGDVPPSPDEHLVSLEAYLRGLGHLKVAQPLRASVLRVDQAIQALRRTQFAGVSKTVTELKTLLTVLERDVAPALNVPVMFSSSDGD